MRTQSMCSLWRDPIIVFTVTDWSPWWFVKKGLFIFIFIFLCTFVGDATSEVHTVPGKDFVLSQPTLECPKPTSTWTTWPPTDHSSLAGKGIVYRFSLEADFCPFISWMPLEPYEIRVQADEMTESRILQKSPGRSPVSADVSRQVRSSTKYRLPWHTGYKVIWCWVTGWNFGLWEERWLGFHLCPYH